MSGNGQRLKPPYQRTRDRLPSVSLDERGYVYLGSLKVARYYRHTRCLEFHDPRTTQRQGRRVVAIDALKFCSEIIRLTEQVDISEPT